MVYFGGKTMWLELDYCRKKISGLFLMVRLLCWILIADGKKISDCWCGIRSLRLDFEYCRKKISDCWCEIKRWGFEMRRWRKWISGDFMKQDYVVLLSFYGFRIAHVKII